MPSLNVDIDFPDHPQTLRLVRLVGDQAAMILFRLWSYAGKFAASDGILLNCSAEEIERICGWRGRKGKAVKALVTTGYLECRKNTYVLHNWVKHQGHIARFRIRAQVANTTRWSKDPTRTPKSIQQGSNKDSLVDPSCVSQGLLNDPTRTPRASPPPSLSPPSPLSPPYNPPHTPHLPLALPPPAVAVTEQRAGIPQGTVVGETTAARPHKTPDSIGDSAAFEGEKESGSKAENGTAFAEWPTHGEWCAAARMEGMTTTQLETEWANQERKAPIERWRGIDRTRLRHHASFVLAKIRERTGGKAPAGARGAAKAFAHEVGEEAEIKILNKEHTHG